MATNTNLSRTNETMYAVAWVVDPDAEEPDYDDPEVLRRLHEEEQYEPEGWREYALEAWPEKPEYEDWPNGYKPFFWPSTKRLYTTRKAAEGRRDLINRWGGNAVVVVAEIDWIPLEEMDAKWKRERLLREREKIEAQLAELESGNRRLGVDGGSRRQRVLDRVASAVPTSSGTSEEGASALERLKRMGAGQNAAEGTCPIG
ncbi:hypothetical protein MUN78_10065 [Leucobacter allii]|uniref:Transposase n=1 Tax=Leucobacter allii TaxID=2932247 RepID=A0ABY4FH93_9MICO|nr:hypothetical protein [Leucobacter allii]UOQ56048.1 hypothetical protein MUN78_10065 [Leucobacter allii]